MVAETISLFVQRTPPESIEQRLFGPTEHLVERAWSTFGASRSSSDREKDRGPPDGTRRTSGRALIPSTFSRTSSATESVLASTSTSCGTSMTYLPEIENLRGELWALRTFPSRVPIKNFVISKQAFSDSGRCRARDRPPRPNRPRSE